MKVQNTMQKPTRKDCLYYVLGECARNDEGIAMKPCKRRCALFLIKPWAQKYVRPTSNEPDYPDNTYNDCGFNGLKEDDYA